MTQQTVGGALTFVVWFTLACGPARATDVPPPVAAAHLRELTPARSPQAIGGGPPSTTDATVNTRLAAARCDYLARCGGPVDADCVAHERTWLERRVSCREMRMPFVERCVRALKEQSCDRVLEVTAGLPECSAAALCVDHVAPITNGP
jgi:hypothetical protein